jgi:hypothetical protein
MIDWRSLDPVQFQESRQEKAKLVVAGTLSLI